MSTLATRSDVDVLLDLNRDYIRSVQASDVRRFNEILADDFMCSNPDGSLVDREGFLTQTARPVGIRRVFMAGSAKDNRSATAVQSRWEHNRPPRGREQGRVNRDAGRRL